MTWRRATWQSFSPVRWSSRRLRLSWRPSTCERRLRMRSMGMRSWTMLWICHLKGRRAHHYICWHCEECEACSGNLTLCVIWFMGHPCPYIGLFLIIWLDESSRYMQILMGACQHHHISGWNPRIRRSRKRRPRVPELKLLPDHVLTQGIAAVSVVFGRACGAPVAHIGNAEKIES